MFAEPRNRTRSSQSSNVKTAVFWVVLTAIAALLFAVVRTGRGPKEGTLNFTEFLNKVKTGLVGELVIAGQEAHGVYKAGNFRFQTQIPSNYPQLYDLLADKNVNVTVKEASSTGWISILLNASPFILLMAFVIFMMRRS